MKDLYKIAHELGFIPDNLTISWKTDSYLWMCELQRWLREVHKIGINIDFHESPNESLWYQGCVYYSWCEEEYDDDAWFSTYEEALEDALLDALKIVKEKVVKKS